MKKYTQFIFLLLSFFVIPVTVFAETANAIVELPFVGELDIGRFSLPALAVVLGTVDGLNVCSIGALIMVLSIVLIFKRRILILLMGGLFLSVVVIVYGFLVMMWHQVFVFILPYFSYMRIAIGIIASIGGLYFFNEFLRLRKSGLACSSDSNKYVKKAVEHLQKTFKSPKKNIAAMVMAVIIFAMMATVIEFPCSAAIPVVFTGILAEANLGIAAYSFYIALYLLLYLLIEIVIFVAAVFTKQLWLGFGGFVTYATLAGSLALFFIAYYYIFGVSL